MNRHYKVRASLLAIVLCIFCVGAVQACPVCFGAKDAPVNQASVQAIGVLLGCTGIVAAGISGFVARIYFRMRNKS